MEKPAALTRPPQRKARPVSSQAERGSLRRGELLVAWVNGRRSSRSGQRVVDSEVIAERFAVGCCAPARQVRATLASVTPDRDDVLRALEQVIDPELRRPVTELDMVRDLEIHDGVVAFTIVLTIAGCPLRDSFEEQVEQVLAGVPGVTGVELSFDVMTPEERQVLTQKLRGGAPERDGVIRLPDDCRVLAVASGKGGVGKSSLSANLAVAFSQFGHRVGVLDADIYGHSIPHILGIRQRPVAVDELIVPPVKDDLKLMSIGFFLESSNEPVMWRGPMLHRALEQFLTDVHWGEIDVLVVDMPPGTGDVSISLGQLLPRAEVIVVTTPQKLAQDVAARAAAMAQKTNMRLLGVIENMSGDVFGSGGGKDLAGELGVPLLGTVPLDPVLREQGDAGAPVVSAQPEAESAEAIVAIAQEIEALRRERGAILKSLPLVG
jgi:ATP-binding protein involved in chromosome partitioning